MKKKEIKLIFKDKEKNKFFFDLKDFLEFFFFLIYLYF
jgi:hypothetical protein